MEHHNETPTAFINHTTVLVNILVIFKQNVNRMFFLIVYSNFDSIDRVLSQNCIWIQIKVIF